MSGRLGAYRRARDEARAAKLRRRYPAYHIVGGDGSWNAVHLQSLDAFPPMPLRRLRREIQDDAWRRAARTLNGALIAIRAVTR